MKKTKVKHILFLILFSLAFNFAHSELDFLNFDDSDHHAHDFCELAISSNHSSLSQIKSVDKLLTDFVPVAILFDSNCNMSFSSYFVTSQHFKNPIPLDTRLSTNQVFRI